MSSTAGALPTPVLRNAAQVIGRSLLSLLVALSLVMLLRRASGAFVQPLGGVTLVVIASTLMLAVMAVRAILMESVARTMYSVLSTQYLVHGDLPSILAGQPVANTVVPAAPLVCALPGLAAAVLLAALTLPGTPVLAIAFAWFILISSEGLSWLAACHPAIARLPGGPRAISGRIATEEVSDESETELPSGLVQQLTRIREEGRESIHAVLLAEIPAGDRQAAIHVAFCPPLDQKPVLTAHALDCDDAEVRITQAETFGARIEVRLPTAADTGRRTALVELLGSAICR
jgi:hypothetical protein